MNRAIFSILLALGSNYALAAQTDEELKAMQLAVAAEATRAQGLPAPGDGIVLVNRKDIHWENMFDDDKEYKAFMEELAAEKASIEKLGYVEENNKDAQKMLNFQDDYRFGAKNKQLAIDELRQNLSDIKMAYSFKGVPKTVATEVLGYNEWLGEIDAGFPGIQEYFINPDLGICIYYENNLKYTGGSIQLVADEMTNEVNGKYTETEIRGSKKSGFVYTVYWYDNKYFRQLDCAWNRYSKNHMKKVVETSGVIDKAL